MSRLVLQEISSLDTSDHLPMVTIDSTSLVTMHAKFTSATFLEIPHKKPLSTNRNLIRAIETISQLIIQDPPHGKPSQKEVTTT